MILQQMTYRQMTFRQMTFRQMTYRQMTFRQMTFRQMTYQNRMISNQQFIPCISGDMMKVKKMDIKEDQRRDIIKDIGMENGTDIRKGTKKGSIEVCGLEQHGLLSYRLSWLEHRCASIDTKASKALSR